jgi:hypothetical protein
MLTFGGFITAANTGSAMGIAALVFYHVYTFDYAPRQEVIAQAMRAWMLQEEARRLKEDSKEKAELEALREKVRQLEEEEKK